MAKVIEEMMVCADCIVAIANDDYTGLSDAEEKRVRAGINALHKEGYPTVGDSDKYDDFSRRDCPCCGALAGPRHHVVLLGDD
jgi:hypothetical protein